MTFQANGQQTEVAISSGMAHDKAGHLAVVLGHVDHAIHPTEVDCPPQSLADGLAGVLQFDSEQKTAEQVIDLADGRLMEMAAFVYAEFLSLPPEK